MWDSSGRALPFSGIAVNPDSNQLQSTMNKRENTALTPKRWLVVDDDPALLALTVRVLRSVPDQEVVECDNPRQALELFTADPESFELLVTDFEMPELNGCDLARRARTRAPQLRVLLISGRGIEASDAASAGLDAFLSKPFQPEDLLEAVRILQMRLDNRPRRRMSTVHPENSQICPHS